MNAIINCHIIETFLKFYILPNHFVIDITILVLLVTPRSILNTNYVHTFYQLYDTHNQLCMLGNRTMRKNTLNIQDFCLERQSQLGQSQDFYGILVSRILGRLEVGILIIEIQIFYARNFGDKQGSDKHPTQTLSSSG